MQTQQVILDILKPTGTIVDLSDSFNARVGDQMTPFQLFILEGGVAKDLKGMHPELEAVVGNGALKGNKAIMNAGAKGVHWVGSTNNVTGYNQLTLAFPAEVFPQSGFCYGHLILANEAGVRESSVDIWFQVLDGTPQMGMVADHYDSELALELSKAKNMNDRFSQEMRAAYSQQVTDAQNALIKATSDLSHLARTTGLIQSQIDANNFESRSAHDRDFKNLSEMIEHKLANMSDNVEWLQNKDAITTKYPKGAEGLKITVDTGHKWLWFNNNWTDCGIYQVAENSEIVRNHFISTKADMKIPYDNLDTLPVNSIVTYVSGLNVANCPAAITGNYTVQTIGSSNKASDNVGAVQMLFSEDNSSYYYRSAWSYPGTKWSSWQSCGDSKIFINKEDLVSPYDNLDILPSGSVITYTNGILDKDFPFTSQGFTVFTNGKGFSEAHQIGISAGKIQFVITNSPSNFYYRSAWGSAAKWSAWKSINNSYVFTSKDGLIDRFKDLDTLPAGSTVTYVAGILDQEFPYVKDSQGFTVITNGDGFADDDDNTIKAGQVQRVTCTNGSEYHRIAWGSPAKWSAWQIDSYESRMQKNNLPSLSIFKSFGVIGDSFSKGYIQKPDGTVLGETDNKWGSFMASQYGTKFTDFSVSGQTTNSFVNNTLETLQSSNPLDAYFILLGINDAAPYNKIKLGSIDDIKASATDNPRTFFGDYGRIINTALTVSPNARIVLFTIMANWGERQKYDAAIKEIGKHYNLPVINVLDDPYFSSSEYTALQSGGHPTVVGYGILANHLMELIQKCVVDNPDYFNFMGLE